MNESLNCTLGRHSGHTAAHNSMFLQWCRDELVLSFIFVQRFRFEDRTRLRKGTTAETQTLCTRRQRVLRGQERVSVYYVCTTGQVERKNKFGPRALVITRGQTVPGDMAASRGHTAG